MKPYRYNTAVILGIISLLLLLPLQAFSEDTLRKKPNYTITGYSFDYDAVTEKNGSVHLETSLFKPLMITNSTSDLFGSESPATGIRSSTGKSAPHGFAIAAEYLATPSLAFLGAIGVTSGQWDADSSLQQESSWEANLGVVYKFFNALAYEVHFGYMDTGDLFQQSETYSEIDSIIMLSNKLTLSF